MPERSGFPEAVRGAGADRFGLPSGPEGTGFGKLRHCAAAGSARNRVIAVVASEVRMDGIVCAPFLRRVTRSGGEGPPCTKRHAGCFAVGAGDIEMAPTRFEIEALVVRIQEEFLQS